MTELIPGDYEPITIKIIEQDEDYESENKVLIGVLLSMKTSEKQKGLQQYSKQYNKKKVTTTTYNRLLTFGSSNEGEGKTFCMVFNDSQSFRFFINKMQRMKVGDAVAIYEPEKITNWLSKDSDLPVVNSGLLPFCHKVEPSLYMIQEIPLVVPEEGYTRFFHFIGVKITFKNAKMIPVVCQGLMCDKQNDKKCACLIGHKTPRIVLSVKVKLTEDRFKGTEEMNILSWELTQNLFSDIHRDATITSFHDLVRLRGFRASINRIANIVNDNGGWSVVGWVRKGFTLDETTIHNEEEMVGAENVSPHIIALRFPHNLNEDAKENIKKEKYSMTTFTTEALTTVNTTNATDPLATGNGINNSNQVTPGFTTNSTVTAATGDTNNTTVPPPATENTTVPPPATEKTINNNVQNKQAPANVTPNKPKRSKR